MLLEMFEPALRLAVIAAFTGLSVWVGVGSIRETWRYFVFHIDLELKEEQWMAQTASS